MVFLSVIFSSMVAFSAPADAQESTSAPDVVLLESGGILRGTISEYDPASHVTIVLPTGDVRRIEVAETRYVGPAADAPRATSPAPTSDATPTPATPAPAAEAEAPAEGRARVELEASPASATFFRYVDGQAEMLCQGHCELEVPSGATLLGLARPGEAPRPSAAALDLRDGDVVTGRIMGSRGARMGIGITSGAMMLAGLITLIVKADDRHDCRAALDDLGLSDEDCARGGVIAGGLVLGAGGVLLPALAAFRSRVETHVLGRDAAVSDDGNGSDGSDDEPPPEAAVLQTTLEACAEGEPATFTVRLDDNGEPEFLRGPQGAIRVCLWSRIEGMTIPELAGTAVELRVNQP